MIQRKLSVIRNHLLDLMPKAGQILRKYFHAEALQITRKGHIDIVTEADLEVDQFFRTELSRAYKDIPVLTEETAPSDIETLADAEYLWVVDPLDGTANFARNDGNFSISVALVSRSVPLLGVIFVPVSSRLFWAQQDKEGAFWNGRRIHVSNISDLRDAVVCTDWSHILGTRDKTTGFLRKIYGNVRQFKILGSAATDITLLARGGVDIYHHVHLMPWDIAAAALIAQKAGAKITDIYGKPWNVFTPSILAANPNLHTKMLNFLQNKNT